MQDIQAKSRHIISTLRFVIFRRLWWAGLCLLLMVHLFPIRTGIVRYFLIVLAGALWFTLFPLYCRRLASQLVWLAGTVAILGLLFGPARMPQPSRLRNAYTASLRKYEGARYIWGGESPRGIDCSGLVRVALIDANFEMGLREMRPGLIRQGISLWWQDCSAAALKDGYRNLTAPVCGARDLHRCDYTTIRPGDFCVTASGQHTMAYLGECTWIEADPGEGRVILLAPNSRSPWLDSPMQIMRWAQLP